MSIKIVFDGVLGGSNNGFVDVTQGDNSNSLESQEGKSD